MVFEPRNRWGYAPRSWSSACYRIAGWLIVLGGSSWQLAAHDDHGGTGSVLLVIVIVLAALNLIRVVVGLARMRRS